MAHARVQAARAATAAAQMAETERIAVALLASTIGLNGRYNCAYCDSDWSHTEPLHVDHPLYRQIAATELPYIRQPCRRTCSIKPRAPLTHLPWPSFASVSATTSVAATLSTPLTASSALIKSTSTSTYVDDGWLFVPSSSTPAPAAVSTVAAKSSSTTSAITTDVLSGSDETKLDNAITVLYDTHLPSSHQCVMSEDDARIFVGQLKHVGIPSSHIAMACDIPDSVLTLWLTRAYPSHQHPAMAIIAKRIIDRLNRPRLHDANQRGSMNHNKATMARAPATSTHVQQSRVIHVPSPQLPSSYVMDAIATVSAATHGYGGRAPLSFSHTAALAAVETKSAASGPPSSTDVAAVPVVVTPTVVTHWSPIMVNSASRDLWNALNDGTATIASITLLIDARADVNLRHPYTGRSVLHQSFVEAMLTNQHQQSSFTIASLLLRYGADADYVAPCEGAIVNIAMERSQSPDELLTFVTSWLHHGGTAATVSLHDLFVKCWNGRGSWREIHTSDCTERWNWPPSLLDLTRLLVAHGADADWIDMPNNSAPDRWARVPTADRIMTPIGISSTLAPLYIGAHFEAPALSSIGARTRTLSVVRIERPLHQHGSSNSNDQWCILARYHTLSSCNDEWMNVSTRRLRLCYGDGTMLYGDCVRQRATLLKWIPFVNAMIAGDTDRAQSMTHAHGIAYATTIGTIMTRDVAMVICSFLGFTLIKHDETDDLA